MGIRDGVCGVVSWLIGTVVWVLEVGEGEAEDVVWDRGTLRVTLLVLEVVSVSLLVSASSVLSVSEDVFFLRDALIAASLATASLMWAGTRTQANVRS